MKKAGFCKLPGTAIKNTSTGEVLHTPPQDYKTIVQFMGNLEQYINNAELVGKSSFYLNPPLFKIFLPRL